MKTTWQKDGFTIRLAKASDVDDYYFQNYCPLDKEVARLTGCKEHFTKEDKPFRGSNSPGWLFRKKFLKKSRS